MKKSKRTIGSFSLKELTNEISRLYNIKPTAKLKKQIEIALKRGVSYGILIKYRNKYRFDPEAALRKSLKKTSRKRRLKIQQASSKKRPRVPLPTVPPPPSWNGKPRNLLTEPYSQAIKKGRNKKK